MIDRSFIKNWIPDDKLNKKKEKEEKEYNEILETIQKQAQRIDKDTFQKIYDWKARRSGKKLQVIRICF